MARNTENKHKAVLEAYASVKNSYGDLANDISPNRILNEVRIMLEDMYTISTIRTIISKEYVNAKRC